MTQIESQTKLFDRQSDVDSKIEDRLKALFSHYSRAQCTGANHTFTFDKLMRDSETLSGSEWMALCRDFDLLCKRHPTASLFAMFKKVAKGRESITFAEFKKVLSQFSDLEFSHLKNEEERTAKMWDKLELHDPVVG